MQSYENAGGYGLPAYYNMGLAAGYGGNGAFLTSPVQNLLAASQGYRGMGLGGSGLGTAGIARGRGAMMRGGSMRGRGGAKDTFGSSSFNGRGGSKMMRGRGGASAQRFNPMSGQKNKNENDDSGHIVFCYNIGQHSTEDDVRQLFSLYGTVNKVDVIMNHAKNITKGYAFITMPDHAEAAYAIEQLNGYNYSGKPLQVSFKSDKKN